jgi:hypothetical protein
MLVTLSSKTLQWKLWMKTLARNPDNVLYAFRRQSKHQSVTLIHYIQTQRTQPFVEAPLSLRQHQFYNGRTLAITVRVEGERRGKYFKRSWIALISDTECFVNKSSVLSKFGMVVFGTERFANWSLTLVGIEVVVCTFDDKCPFSTTGEAVEGRCNIGHV